MRLLVAAVGRLRGSEEETLVKRYLERATALGRSLALGPVEVAELKEGMGRSPAERKAEEATKLLAASAEATVRIALDERGKARTSVAFAELLRAERDVGTRTVAFLIGGPDGHGDEALSAARERFSLGPMTLPHGLARVILLEQIYRAVTILSGHPYHRV